jgi:protein phosphatase
VIEIAFGEATDAGLDPSKKINEDACRHVETPLGHLFIMCDGMGGHAGGKQASEIAVNTIAEQLASARADNDPRDMLRRAVELSAQRVYDFGGSGEQAHRPGATCVAMLLHDGHAQIAHVGDSRCYGIRGEQIYQLTRDHSVVQQMLDNGLINLREAVGHPDSNKITRALGMRRDVEVELREQAVELFAGDIFLLCTDGLTDMARDRDIMLTARQYADSAGLQAACDELVALANRRGGNDNITVQLVQILSADPKERLDTLAQPPLSHELHAGSEVPTTIDGGPPSRGLASPAVSTTIAAAPPEPPQPPSMQPPSTQPPSTQPPSTQPPSTQPPSTQPPSTQPPTAPSAPPPASEPTAQQPAVPAMSLHRRPPPQPSRPPNDGSERTVRLLVKIVFGLALLSGFLLAALLWALLYR